MPCYDIRDSVEYKREEWIHNSPVAELLCYVLSRLEHKTPYDDKLAEKLAAWWIDHQERDATKDRA